jgi:cell division septum initiation protein DivIVA
MKNVIERVFSDFHRDFYRGLDRGAQLVAIKLADEAVKNAPRSPTHEQAEERYKRMGQVDGKSISRKQRKEARRLARNMRTAGNPGGLERSIQGEYERSKKEIRIFVASNSEAGSYAVKMHDEKGITWHNRGAGTIAKGARADHMFIERAIDENESKVAPTLEAAIMQEIAKGSGG